MATGLLTLGVGPSTRLLTYLVGLDKTYETTIRLGHGTTTDDAEGEPLSTPDPAALEAVTDEHLAAGIRALTGDIEQVPSAVSAIKVDGRRAYDRVRAGEEVELASRRVTVAAFDVLAVRRHPDAIEVEARIDCSSGPTFVRSPVISAPRSAPVGTSPPCGARGSGRFPSTVPSPSTTSTRRASNPPRPRRGTVPRAARRRRPGA